MPGYHSRWKFRDLEMDKRRRNQYRHGGRRSGGRLKYKGVDALDLPASALLIRSFIDRFGVVLVRRDVRMNQRSVMAMMRVRGSGRCVHMRVRQHCQAQEDDENGRHRPQTTQHSFYRSASSLDCQAAARPPI
jgi:hypothetical protein